MPGVRYTKSNKIVDIKALVLDVDGVLTDSMIYITDDGVELKAFNARDGHGIRMLMRAGIVVAMITGRMSGALKHRAKELGIEHVIEGSLDKGKSIKEVADRLGIGLKEIAYMGDDVVDLPAMSVCGFSIAPSDAIDEVKARADIITRLPGGKGAVREAIDIILKSKGLYHKVMARYGV
ncbi:MAG TPA: HAD-IIIA family hydrolase [Deltaproteobacteria bacterium]|nr:HAD-IIIA family hydrolase [Deltaproteobacteria bacterium]